MLEQLFFTNIFFAVKVFTSLVFFATAWLHIDSWRLNKKEKPLLFRSLGFFMLALVSIVQATAYQPDLLMLLTQVTKITGLLIILASLIAEPILRPPKRKSMLMIPFLFLSQSLVPLSSVVYLIISLTYLRKSTEGFEKQIKPMFLAFLLFSLSETVNISFFAKDSNIVFFSKLLTEFGPLWIAALLLEVIGVCVMAIWTWGFLRFRAQIQLFIIFVSTSLFIFTITTFSFTYLLLNNISNDTLNHLKTDVKVLEYAVDSLKSSAESSAKVIAENSEVKNAVESNNSEKLFNISVEFMISQQTDFLEVTDKTGKVIMRASDNEKIGDSLSEDIIVKSALSGTPLSTVRTKSGVLIPEVQISASAPVIVNNGIIGSVITGFTIDNAFVDGVKAVTGLDASVFADNIRAATTFISPDGKRGSLELKRQVKK